MSASDPVTSERFPLLLFFDGECVFCNRWVNRVRDADQGRRIRFGTKQGTTFAQLAQSHPELAKVESLVLAIRRPDGGEDFLVRSAAVRELIKGLPGFGFWSALLTFFPTFLANIGYCIFAKLRTPLFGREESCRVPKASERMLFVE